MSVRAVVLHANDNVATLMGDGKSGETCAYSGARQGEVNLRQDVPFGHKIALEGLAAGEDVRKYGQVVGRMTASAQAGEHVHVHNVESLRGRGDLVAKEGAK